MSDLAGLRPLLLLIARLDRVRLGVWVAVLGLLPLLVGTAFVELYDTEASRVELVGTLSGSPAFTALLGPINGTSIGALVVWRVGTIGAVMVAFMAAFAVVRHTRAHEETGRAELLGATVVGRDAPLAAAVLAVAVAGGAIALLVAGGLVALGEAASGALALAAGWSGTALVFATLGAVAAQVSESARGARLLAGGGIGALYALRMVGDGFADRGWHWLTWASPLGWVTNLRAYADERWWVLGLLVLLSVAAGALAVALEARRDLGAGMFPTRPGPAEAPPALASASGLGRRLHLRGLVGWGVGMTVFGGMWGVLADTMTALLDENPQLAALLEAMGGSGVLEDTFFATAFGLIAIFVSAYGISVVLHLRDEEESTRAESLLATPVGRLPWAGGHLVFAFAGPALLLALGAVASATSFALVQGEAGDLFGRVTQLALAQLPAVWVIVGAAVALFGLRPGWTSWAWGALVWALLLGQLGEIMGLPDWMLDLSPFTHVPTPPAALTVGPLLALTLVAAALVAVGIGGLRRRDIG